MNPPISQNPPDRNDHPTLSRDRERIVCTEKESVMPKMKTSKTAAKRFSKTGTGKLRRLQQNRQHMFEKKPSTRTRRLDGMVAVHSGDEKKIKRLLGER
jgi:large subunit ribosomal protein L35